MAVINTAAASVPAWCEQHQDAAIAINVPTQLLTTLQRRGGSALLIHISTDQVYSGNDPPQGGWRETDEPAPINAYGRTKLEAEQAVKVGWEGSRFWVGSAPMAGCPGQDKAVRPTAALISHGAGWLVQSRDSSTLHHCGSGASAAHRQASLPLPDPTVLCAAGGAGRRVGGTFVSGLLRCNALAQSQYARPNRSLLRRFCRGKGPISQTSGGRRWRWQTFAGRAWS